MIPRTEEELRELIERLADPEEMGRWLESIWEEDDYVRPPLDYKAGQWSDQRGPVQEVRGKEGVRQHGPR